MQAPTCQTGSATSSSSKLPSTGRPLRVGSRPNGKPKTDERPPPVSKINVLFTIPTLTECCLRVLLAPHHLPDTSEDLTSRIDHPRSETRLEAMYALPLPDVEYYPAPVIDTFRTCVPKAVAKPDPQMRASPSKRARRGSGRSRVSSAQSDVFGSSLGRSWLENIEADDPDDEEDDEEETPPGIGTCMSPMHPRHRRPAFVKHAVERFAWVRTVAGQPVQEDGGVPVRWRGCMSHCLDFLDEDEPHGDTEVQDDAGQHSDDVADEKIDGDDSDGDSGVEAIDLGGGLGVDFD